MVRFEEALFYVKRCAESEKNSLIDPSQAIFPIYGKKKKKSKKEKKKKEEKKRKKRKKRKI